MVINYRIFLDKLVIILFLFAPFISLLIYNLVGNKFISLLPQLSRELIVIITSFLFFLSNSLIVK